MYYTDAKPLIVKECGIDYLTLHIPEWDNSERGTIAELIKEYEQAVGAVEPLRERGLLGYQGVGDDHAFFGQRDDGYMVRLSSGIADMFFERVCLPGDKPSRIDVQVTIGEYYDPVEAIQLFEQTALIAAEQLPSQRIRNITTFRDNKDGYTLYIGSRSSEAFARIYNKYAQSGESQYVGCVRFEVELHREAATNVASQLLRYPGMRVDWAVQYIGNFLWSRGVELPIKSVPYDWVPETKPVQLPKDAITLKWLEAQVAPACHRLLKYHSLTTILEALKLLDNVLAERNTLQ